MNTVYIETSIVSYVTSRPSRDVVLAADQALTRAWWRGRSTYELLVSHSYSTKEHAMKHRDAIVEDLHKFRERMGRAHGFDVDRIAATIRQHERESGVARGDFKRLPRPLQSNPLGGPR